MTPPVLDMTAGPRSFWWDKHDPRAVFVDKRCETITVTDNSEGNSSGVRTVTIAPDIQMDWTKEPLPWPDGTFHMVVLDPPHLTKAGENSWLKAKYSTLDELWPNQLRRAFSEAMRVLKPWGTLVFKWNDDQVRLADALAAIDYRPLFGDKRSKTHWLIFMKDRQEDLIDGES